MRRGGGWSIALIGGVALTAVGACSSRSAGIDGDVEHPASERPPEDARDDLAPKTDLSPKTDLAQDEPIDGPEDGPFDGIRPGLDAGADGLKEVGHEDGSTSDETDGDANSCPERADAGVCATPTALTWVVTPVPVVQGMTALGGVTPAGVFTFTPTRELERWTNPGSVVVTPPAPFVGDLRASGDDDIWIVPPSGAVATVNPYFVGTSSGSFAHWDGAAWSVVPPPAASAGVLTSFWIVGAQIWAAVMSSSATSSIYRWSDTAWSPEPSPLDGLKNASIKVMWGAAPDDVWAGGQVGIGGTIATPIKRGRAARGQLHLDHGVPARHRAEAGKPSPASGEAPPMTSGFRGQRHLEDRG